MNDATLTLAGNVVDEPRMRCTKSGHMVTNFRLASTARRKNMETGAWEDISTLFVTVTCWRALAENVFESLHKGQPVIATGRYYARQYTIDEATRVSYELEATSVGHDLGRGVTQFRKATRAFPANQVELDAEGMPAERSDAWVGAVEGDGASLDPAAETTRTDEPARSGALAAVG